MLQRNTQRIPTPFFTVDHMNLNHDFSKRVVSLPEQADWVPSPMPGVERRMLDRVGDEVAQATSVVRYEKNSAFDSHEHAAGEEILVLQGVFSDETGDFPAGSYLRNPPGSSHAPFSEEGCLLFVKLRQFAANDVETVRINTLTMPWRQGLVPGLSVMPLHSHEGVDTALVRWAPNTRFNRHVHVGGEEILVLEGVFSDENGDYPQGSWLRNPRMSQHTPYTGNEGALIYVKVGHLP